VAIVTLPYLNFS